MGHSTRFALNSFLAASTVSLTLSALTYAAPADQFERVLPASIAAARLDAPVSMAGQRVLSPGLLGAQGETEVIVRLRTQSIAELGLTGTAATKAKRSLQDEQQALLQRIQKLDPNAEVVAQVQVVLNAVFVKVNAAVLPLVASDPGVLRVAKVGNYELDLSETVPYIGAAAVQDTDVDGSGIKVAVLDSGIDYTHANLGGGGTLEDYEAAYGTSTSDPANTTTDGLFPTEKVASGYDFVGEAWPGGDLAPDPDPIDFEGHGTHVADIIGGAKGVAPGVVLYAVKTCSAVSSSCSGIALIQGMEYSVDPDGDGNPKDRVDIINMSLGSS